ncbi:FAD-dependent oxidoreductase [Kineococcus sp. LSe6-4]|uniref:FAD-dependent oxidoreductase n=1 Tax=Kineococcus halophytocola TaxID=3234027 RepID=A0ABV4H1D8_9ACTN
MTSNSPGHDGTASPPPSARTCDVAVVGGSAAGLAAALQLVRQRRSVLVVDDGTPRNAPAAHMHGFLGHDGLPPGDLVARGREEVRGYGGEVLTGRVLGIGTGPDGGFDLALTGGNRLRARRVLVATGIVDELPDIPGLAQRWGRQVIHCPFCHGYEVRDRRVVQIVTSPAGLHPTPLVRHLTDRLTVVLHDGAGVDPVAVRALTESGVPVLEATVARVGDGDDGALVVELGDGRALPADAVLTGGRFAARTSMLEGLGVATALHPSGLGDVLVADPTGSTTVDGVFAAGNVTDPALQVLPAAAHGSFVGAQIAFSLAAEDVATGTRPSGVQAEWDDRYGGTDRVWSANPNGTLVAELTGTPPGRALDVGAGEGADALWLAENGWEVTASDVSDRALARIRAEATRRGTAVETLHRDVNDLAGLEGRTYDLVSLQYGSFHRTPDQRGLHTLLDAVATGGMLLVVGHAPHRAGEPVDPAERTVLWDPQAYVGIEEIAAAVAASGRWRVEVHETRPRPAGAVSSHHAEDVVFRAVRTA